jgi:hypothetical protein
MCTSPDTVASWPPVRRLPGTGMLRRLAACAAALLWSCAVPAWAQPAESTRLPMPAISIGAGGGPSSNDASSRMRLLEDGLAAVWLVEVGAAVADRVSLGLEFSRPTAATAFTTVGLGRSQVAGRQEEWVLMPMARVRLAGRGRWAFDAVGGAGLFFQRHESGSCTPAQDRCETTDNGPSRETFAWTGLVGVDVPLRIARHFEIAAGLRSYFLRRQRRPTVNERNLEWQFETRPSTRVAAVVVVRVVR